MADHKQDGVAKTELWQRSENLAEARRFDPDASPMPHPANEIERILREYACECYAVGRGESMFYLVEDLPKLARQATREIVAIEAEGAGGKRKALVRTEAGRKAYSSTGLAGLPKLAKSVVAVLPLIAVLAALGIAIGLTFSESIAALVGGP